MLGRAPMLDYVVCGYSVLELPVLVGFLVWGVEDRFFCERRGHISPPSASIGLPFTYYTIYFGNPRPPLLRSKSAVVGPTVLEVVVLRGGVAYVSPPEKTSLLLLALVLVIGNSRCLSSCKVR